MIHCRAMLEDDTPVAEFWVHSVPRSGEFIWLTGSEAHKRPENSYRVTEVAHWVHPGWVTSPHMEAPHSACLYVEPVDLGSRENE